MAYEVLMPKLSSTMTEGSITQWFKEEGESVEVGEAIFEVMTDKIAIEVEAYEEGILLKRYYQEDQSAPINSIVAYLGETGEKVPDKAPILMASEEIPTPIKQAVIEESKLEQTELLRATPAARKLARERGIELSKIFGSGRNGRIHVSDVSDFNMFSKENDQLDFTETVVPWKGMRKAVADAMSRSKKTIPHVTMECQVDLLELIKLRQQLLPLIEKQTAKRMSYIEVIIKAVSIALKKFPRLNAHALEDGIHEYSQVNMGIAVALTEGLIVPVIKEVEQLSLSELTVSVKELTQKAREGQLTSAELSGGTFTISSLGKGTVRHFNPVVNSPEVAILGVSSIFDAPYQKETQIEMRPSLTLCLSFDHRVIDGAPVADFLTVLVDLLEHPYGLLV